MIEVKNLVKTFGYIKAIDDVSFKINPGEVVGFLGPNGAGKTTLIRLITGYMLPDSGNVEIDGISMNTNAIELQKNIGYLPENNPIYKNMIVSDLLNLAAELKNINKKDRKELFDFAVSSVGIKDVYYRPIGELSKGYKQRVGIATVLLNKPNVIIMDEPTEGLDPTQRGEIRELIKKLAQDRTIIMSTHVMQEATSVCNRILIINNGKLAADGTPDELTSQITDNRVIILDVEGSYVKECLQGLQNLINLEINETDTNRFKVKIITPGDIDLRPDISRFSRENNWTIWEIKEETYNLEDVFQRITTS